MLNVVHLGFDEFQSLLHQVSGANAEISGGNRKTVKSFNPFFIRSVVPT